MSYYICYHVLGVNSYFSMRMRSLNEFNLDSKSDFDHLGYCSGSLQHHFIQLSHVSVALLMSWAFCQCVDLHCNHLIITGYVLLGEYHR